MPSLSSRLSPLLMAALGALASPAPARAQATAVERRAQSDGVALLPTGAALAEQATAPEVNPAGLDYLRGLELHYLHERNIRLDSVGDGLFLGDRWLGALSTGFSVQWIRPGSGPHYRKTAFSLALGGSSLSLGATYNLFSSPDDGALDRLSTFDAGLLMRPSSWLSLGLTAKDLDATRFRGVRLPRRYDLGVGLRPLGDRLWVGADWLVDDVGGLNTSRLNYALGVEPLPGVVVSAGFTHPVQGAAGQVVGQVALTLNTSHLGLGYAVGAGQNLDPGHLVHLRLSRSQARGLSLGSNPYLVLDLQELLSPRRGGLAALLPGVQREPFLELVGALRRVAQDPRVDGVVLRLSELPDVSHARLQELRESLLALRKGGKRVVAVLTEASDAEYYLACAADRIYTVPQATLLINGLSATATFLGETLGKVGVTVDVARVGAYKNAPDEFTRSEMAPEHREALSAYLDGVYGRYVEAISQARKVPPEKVKAALDQGILTPRMAKEAGLVDDVLYPDQLQEVLDRDAGRRVPLAGSYTPDPHLARRWGEQGQVGVVTISGTIADGKSREDPLGAVQVAGAESILKAIGAAVADSSVVAIVVRVDSPGGSGSASDLIWRALRKAREHKPVIASMGDYAASGGYYVAMAADEIVAQPDTLTGSIGVFALKPNLGPLLQKVGVHQEVLRRGERSDLFSLTRPWNEGEQKAMQAYVDDFYDTFITRVAESRSSKLDKAKVDAVGRGRIWSGQKALELGLVDSLGGLQEAIARACDRARVANCQDLGVELFTGSEGGFLGTPLAEAPLPEALARPLREISSHVGLPLWALPEGPLAMLPYRLKFR